MNLRTFLIIAAILALGYGLGLILMPAFMNSTHGLGTGPSEILLARFFGLELLGLGVAAWLSRDLTGAGARPIITGSLIADALGAIFALMATLSGVMNSTGWLAFALYFLLTLGFAYFQFMALASG